VISFGHTFFSLNVNALKFIISKIFFSMSKAKPVSAPKKYKHKITML
jgi:hypothetical protein